jgi:hypothetical protein
MVDFVLGFGIIALTVAVVRLKNENVSLQAELRRLRSEKLQS